MIMHDVFVTGIGQFEYPDVNDLQFTVDEILLESDLSYESGNGLESKLKHWYNHKPNVLDEMESFKPIATWMKSGVQQYAKKIGLGDMDLLCTEIWINVNRGGLQYFHNHTNSYFSSTLYIHFDQDDHPGLTFDKPNGTHDPTLQLKPEIETIYNMDSYTPRIQSGSYLVWPSQLQHGYYHNEKFQKGTPRVSISANYMPTTISNGVYGWKVVRKTN